MQSNNDPRRHIEWWCAWARYSIPWCHLVATVSALWLVACDRAGAVRTKQPARPAPWLGAWTTDGCFHVTLESPRRYRFTIDHVEYRSAHPPDGGRVGVIVHAVGIGDLEPRPIELPRTPRLQFAAEGKASGAFKIELFLIDRQNRHYEPTVLQTICS